MDAQLSDVGTEVVGVMERVVELAVVVRAKHALQLRHDHLRGVAVDLASRQPHRALILVRTFTSIPDAAQSVYPWLPARWLVRNRFDNLQKIARCTRPVFIAHGTTDRLIPFGHGKRLFEAASEPKQFLAMTGLDHNDSLSPEFFAALRSFLNETTAAAVEKVTADVTAN